MIEVDDQYNITFTMRHRSFEIRAGDTFMGRAYEPGWYAFVIYPDGERILYGPIPTEWMAVLVENEARELMDIGLKATLNTLREHLSKGTQS